MSGKTTGLKKQQDLQKVWDLGRITANRIIIIVKQSKKIRWLTCGSINLFAVVHSYNAVPWFTSRGSQLHTQNKGVLNDRKKYFSALLTSSTLCSFLLLLVKMSAVDIWSRASPCFLVSTLVVSVHIWPCQRHCCGSNESHSVCGRSLSSDHSLHCGCYQHCRRCRHCFCHLRRAKKAKQRDDRLTGDLWSVWVRRQL